jgi:LysM repeat protein
MKKKYVLKNKRRFITFLSIASIITFTVLFATNAYGAKVQNFKTITVTQGDTLWDIASQYVGQGQDIREYIYELKTVNKMPTSEIYAGTRLKIPVG